MNSSCSRIDLVTNFLDINVDLQQVGIGEASTAREANLASGTCEDMRERPQHHHVAHDQLLHHHQHQQQVQHEQQQHQQHGHAHHQQQIATAASFHISRPSHPISTIISPPPLHHTTSIILDQDAYHVSRSIMLQNEHFQVPNPT